MNILVCVKQVPDTTMVKIDPVKHTLIRAGVPSILNTFDTYALETALQLREAAGEGKITVISMGPDQAKAILREALSVGADETYLISDRAFGGADTLATSRTLAATIQLLEEKNGVPFDLILCGKQAIDGDTGQVGPELSQHLGRCLITYAVGLELTENGIKAKRESDEGYDYFTAPLPAVVTMNKTPYDMRWPNLTRFRKARVADIPVLTAQEVIVPEDKRGLKGSPTKVKRTYTPVREKNGQKLAGMPAADAAKKLVELMGAAKLI
ncbi:MAG: electron transfer flavoprotein subunit beta/FixA family protein [Oscillospiraceae bacterium]|nr:electron transfer flavoprotein subunit beta/FixA family protein [Oscillospiraceae bacterium]